MSVQPQFSVPWTTTEKAGFRFGFVFFLLYILPFPLGSLPFLSEITALNKSLTGWYHALIGLYTDMWHVLIPWLGERVFALAEPITIFQSGSGDKTYDYVFLFAIVVSSAVATAIWSILDRKRTDYEVLYHWLRVLVRYYLGMTLIVYGVFKIFHLQMPSPYLSQLVQPFGDKSPMGLAWSYVGYSNAFSAFTGIAEALGGFLLFFRRTTTIGALLVACIMLNVAVMNFCFDIPVKLYSSLLLIMAVFLIIPDVKRLWRVLYLNVATAPLPMKQYVRTGWLRKVAVVVKVLFIGSILYGNFASAIDSQYKYGDKRPQPPLYGIYDTEIVVVNQDTVPPLTTDTRRWRQLIIQFEKNAQVKLMNDSIKHFAFEVDTVRKLVSWHEHTDTLNKSTLAYTVDANHLVLSGKIKADSVYAKFVKRDLSTFRLMNRKFRWIHEYPYNR